MAQGTPDRIRTDWLIIALLFAAGLAAAMQFAKIAPVMADVQAAFGLSLVGGGLAVSVIGLVGLVLGVAAGALAAALGLARSILLALGAGCLFAALGAVAPGGLLFLASRLGEGLCHLLIVVTAPALMIAHAREHDRPIALAIWGCFFGFGFGITSMVAPGLIANWGWRSVLAAHAAFIGLVGLLLGLALLRSSHRDSRLPLPGLGRMIDAHRRLYASGAPVLLATCFAAYTMLFLAVLTFLTRYLVDQAGWSAAEAGQFVAALTAVNLVVTLLTGWLVRAGLKFAPGMVSAFAVAALALGFVFVGHPQPLGIMIAATLAMVAFGTMPGLVFTHVPAVAAGAEGTAMTFGGIAQLGNLGTFSGTPLFALAYQMAGWPGGAAFVATVCAIGAGLAVIVARRMNAQTQTA